MEAYDAVIVTCSPRALEMDIKVNRRTFSNEVWAAMQNIHMTRSGKVFVRTKSAFWKNRAPELHNGVFLSGDTTSMAGGWIEGAIHGALDTAMAVIRRLGGEVTGQGATPAKK